MNEIADHFSEISFHHNKVNATGNFEWGGHGGGYVNQLVDQIYIVTGNRFSSNEINVTQKSNGAGVLIEAYNQDQ